MRRWLPPLLLTMLLLVRPAAGETLEEGWDAYNAGDYARALEIFGPLAEAGEPEAAYALGLIHANGLGVVRDDALGAGYVADAASAGYSPAQDLLGYMYDFGLGLPINHDLAEYWYQKAVDAGEINAMNNLAYSWVSRGRRLSEAAALIATAVRAVPEEAAYLDSLGWLLYQTGHYQEAVPPLCEAAKRDPGHPEVLVHLGDAYWRVGREAEARSEWQRALAVAEDPGQLSSNGADFLHGVGVAGWRAAVEDRLRQGLTAEDGTPVDMPTDATEGLPIAPGCDVPVS
jgi:tetratricopeptide (TPR) repeat protein